jgi:HK97 family phage major capsid protein
MFTRTLSAKPTAREVQEALLEAGHYYAGLRAMKPEDRGENFEADVRSAATFIKDADLILTAIQRGSAVIPDPGTGILGGPEAATGMQNPGFRTLGSLVTSDPGYKAFADTRQAGATFYEVEVAGSAFLHNQQFRATVTSAEPGGGAFLPQAPTPIPPVTRQMRMFLRDVLNVQTTNLSSVPYIREVNPASYEYSASAVAENTAKPEVTLDWSQDDAPVRKIAAWVPVTTEIIDDAPTLQGYIDARLAYMLAVREEWEVLNGSGSAPHLKGILQYSDLQLQAFSTDKITTLGLAIGKVENVDGEADGIVMNPVDFWSMVTLRSTSQFDGAGIVGSGLPFTNVDSLGAWGLPVIRTRAVTANSAIVGAWRLGATMFDRMQTTIRIGNQHSDFFTNNKVAVLAEERVALAVHRPDFFVKATLS